MKRAAKTKNQYETYIREYLQRREKIRVRYNWQPGIPNPEYMKASEAIARKLQTWRKAIAKIEKKHRQIKAIHEKMKEFSGYSIRRIKRANREPQTTMKMIFYKYCLEHGLTAHAVTRFMNISCIRTPRENRLRLTRSFKTHPERHQTWKRFCIFMESTNTLKQHS